MFVYVTNKGLARIGVDLFTLERPLFPLLFNPMVLFLDKTVRLIDGVELTDVAIPGNTTKVWTYEIQEAGLGRFKTTEPEKIVSFLRWSRLTVSLGNGQQAHRRMIRVLPGYDELGNFADPSPAVW